MKKTTRTSLAVLAMLASAAVFAQPSYAGSSRSSDSYLTIAGPNLPGPTTGNGRPVPIDGPYKPPVKFPAGTDRPIADLPIILTPPPGAGALPKPIASNNPTRPDAPTVSNNPTTPGTLPKPTVSNNPTSPSSSPTTAGGGGLTDAQKAERANADKVQTLSSSLSQKARQNDTLKSELNRAVNEGENIKTNLDATNADIARLSNALQAQNLTDTQKQHLQRQLSDRLAQRDSLTGAERTNWDKQRRLAGELEANRGEQNALAGELETLTGKSYKVSDSYQTAAGPGAGGSPTVSGTKPKKYPRIPGSARSRQYTERPVTTTVADQ